MSAAYEGRHRRAVRAELIEDAERVKGKWGAAIKRDLNRHVDAYLLYDMHLDLKSVYLQRWSPETRAVIQAARDAVEAAMKAVYRELR